MASQQRSTKISSSLSKRADKGIFQSYGVYLLLILLAVATLSVYLFLLQKAAMSVVVPASNTQNKDPALPEIPLTARKVSNLRQEERKETTAQMHVSSSNIKKETLILTIANVGIIRIVLRPDLSKESVDYVRHIMQADCKRCSLYRAEKPGILQGILKLDEAAVPPVTAKGSCPDGAESVANDCPAWDTKCACHGPVMERGMVAWAAGQTGPDFFIDVYKRKAEWWGSQHTVWGQIQDEASLKLIDHDIFSMETHKQGGLTMLKKPLHFDALIETEEY